MKKILFSLFIMFFPFLIQSQTLSEKLLCKFNELNDVDVYSFKFDEKTNSYLYVKYDSTKELKNSIISNKGNSVDYDYINFYNTIFDVEGNYYIIAELKISDTTYRNTFLKNGKEIFTCDYINTELVEKNGIINIICTDKGKSFITEYDIASGNISKGKAYDELIPCLYDKTQIEGEPLGKLGFTDDNKLFYIAKSNNEAFMVIGDVEQRHFADIDAYSVVQDKSGKFTYVAKDTGSFMYSSDGFVVYGDKRYKTFYSVYNLVMDAYNNIIYIAGDFSDDGNPQKVMNGDKEISKTYSGGLYNLNFTPKGKIYFIASEKKKNSDEYESFVVFDGKEGKRYPSINTLQVLPGDELLFTVQYNDEISYVIKGSKEIRGDKKQFFVYADLLKDGKFAYVSVEYGDYDKKISDKYFVNIDNERLGPYDGMMVLNYENQSYILSDKKGNYAYVVYKIKNNTDYYYAVCTNKGKSREFDNISDVSLYKGKVLYTISRITNKENYIYKYQIYYDNKPLTPEYDNIIEYKFDEKTGLATYLIAKGNAVYKVEIKF
jgi:hypothetical protein